MSDNPYLEVPCPLCKVPAEAECVNTVDGSSRDLPHNSRAVRAQIVRSAIAENLALEEHE